MVARSLLGVSIVALLSGPALAQQNKYKRLLDTIERDDAYKVRMQAIRVLSRRIDKSNAPAPGEVIEALGQAASLDESYLVRGMAVVALGRFADVRTRPYLEDAKDDEESFVRKQADKALGLTPLEAPPPPDLSRSSKSLVLGFSEQPGVNTPESLRDAMVSFLREGYAEKVGDSFEIDDGQGRSGYQLKGSIAERSVKPEGDEQRITVAVKLTIATWPEKNLRQVLSAKASAKTKTKNAAAIERLQKKLLRAAVDRVVNDSMAQIRGG